MGMGVGLGWTAVGGPSGMSDAARSRQGEMAHRMGELRHLAASAHDLQRVTFHYGDTSGIVTAVFELGEAVE